MWVEVRKAPNLIMAEMWRMLLESEGVPTRILPHRDGVSLKLEKDNQVENLEFIPYRVLVPHFRVHVVEEILRKL